MLSVSYYIAHVLISSVYLTVSFVRKRREFTILFFQENLLPYTVTESVLNLDTSFLYHNGRRRYLFISGLASCLSRRQPGLISYPPSDFIDKNTTKKGRHISGALLLQSAHSVLL